MQLSKVWDAPVRIFHWLLVVALIAQYITAEWLSDAMQWHFYIGYFILGLLIFRILWGIVGTRYARFSSFIFSPGTVIDYFKTLPKRESKAYAGHNPAGGLAVFFMLATIAIQTVSGLFMTDDVFLDGPYRYAGSEWFLKITNTLHNNVFWVLTAFVLVHIAAVVFYVRYKKQPLIRSMITGRKPVNDSGIQSSKWGLAIVIAVLAGLAVYYIVVIAPTPPAVESLYF